MPRVPPSMSLACLVVGLSTGVVAPVAAERARGPQLQFDGGLSVAGPAYEHPVAAHWSIAGEAFIFGSYFLPWFDRGDETRGLGAGVRATYFRNPDGRGLYVTPYVRAASIGADFADGDGLAVTGGAFVGHAWRPTSRLDLRAGLGAQWIYLSADHATGGETLELRANTPFVAIDFVVGWRL